jgi:hypothetical protein
MGGRFLSYSTRNNNCQDFILALMQSTFISTSANTLFIKQATQSLLTPQLRKISNTIMDIASGVDKIIQGGEV